MKTEMRLFLLFLSIIICTAGAPHTSRIYGGQNATSGQFPFMALLNDYHQYCNGVIVAPNWILTTAFCVFYTSEAAEVYVGSNINQINGTAYKFFERITHKEYDDWTAHNDIALVRINALLEYGDTIQPVELGEDPAPNSTCTVIGWGITETQNDVPLQYLNSTTIDLALCQDISLDYLDGYYLGPEQICTISGTGQGACFQDYGGALICDGKLSGLYSYPVGYKCGIGRADVFTSIASYWDWIHSYIGSNTINNSM